MEVKSQSELDIKIILVLNEQEAGALHDIVAYGFDAFIGVFKEKLGSHYIDKHMVGAKSLFKTVSEEIPKHLHKVEAARKALSQK